MKSLLLLSTLVLGASFVQGQALRPILDPNCGLPGVRILPGSAEGGDFRVLGTTDLGASGTWETLSELTVGGDGANWLDFDGHHHGQRFFRLEKLPVRSPLATADNFRLIDQQGRSFELHKAGSAQAFVLVFADNASLAGVWEELKALRAVYEPKGVVFWVINAQDDYTSMVAQAKSLNVDLPVLHDRAQMVARAFH